WGARHGGGAAGCARVGGHDAATRRRDGRCEPRALADALPERPVLRATRRRGAESARAVGHTAVARTAGARDEALPGPGEPRERARAPAGRDRALVDPARGGAAGAGGPVPVQRSRGRAVPG